MACAYAGRSPHLPVSCVGEDSSHIMAYAGRSRIFLFPWEKVSYLLLLPCHVGEDSSHHGVWVCGTLPAFCFKIAW